MKTLDRLSAIEVEDKYGPFYITHNINGVRPIGQKGRSFMICRCCIRDKLRAKDADIINMLALIAIAEPKWAEVAIMRFEFGWKVTQIARKYGSPNKWEAIKEIERKVIKKIREGVCQKYAKR
jgi:hypothetical protein